MEILDTGKKRFLVTRDGWQDVTSYLSSVLVNSATRADSVEEMGCRGRRERIQKLRVLLRQRESAVGVRENAELSVRERMRGWNWTEGKPAILGRGESMLTGLDLVNHKGEEIMHIDSR